MRDVKNKDELLNKSKISSHLGETVVSQNTALSSILQFGQLRKACKELLAEEQEQYQKTHVPRFKNEQELGEYLLTPTLKKKKTNINLNFIV